MKKSIIILGSTGSIGKSTLEIVKSDILNFDVELLVAKTNYKLLSKQAIKFKSKFVYLEDYSKIEKLSILLKGHKTKVITNFKKICKTVKKTDLLMSSISGFEGLKYNLELIKKTKKILFANKESIICGWNLIKNEIIKNKCSYVPVDSEHFAIHELIKNSNINLIKDIIITASGGPFLNMKKSEMSNITKKNALKHPRWRMGKKISIDSATLMNKVFEVIEAYRLFNLKPNQVKITIHPQSIVHAIINYKNGTSHALMHNTSMKIPIYSAIYGDEIDSNNSLLKFNINNYSNLNFFSINKNKFSSLNLVNNISRDCNLFDTVIISVNDELVNLFLKDKIKFLDITKKLKKIINMKIFNKYKYRKPKNFNEINLLNHYVRLKTRSLCI